MATHFTCPHCGLRATTARDDIEYVDLGNGLPDAVFPMLAPGEERHIDQRICCDKCYQKAAQYLPAGAPHPYDPATHKARLAAVDALNRKD